MLRMKTQENFLDPIVMKLKIKGTSVQAKYYFRSKHLFFNFVYANCYGVIGSYKKRSCAENVLVYLFLLPFINFGKGRII